VLQPLIQLGKALGGVGEGFGAEFAIDRQGRIDLGFGDVDT
jgi:hypothetical protein